MGVRGMGDPSVSIGVSGVHWGLAGHLGAQGPSGLSVESGGIRRLLGDVGDIRRSIRECQGCIGG